MSEFDDQDPYRADSDGQKRGRVSQFVRRMAQLDRELDPDRSRADRRTAARDAGVPSVSTESPPPDQTTWGESWKTRLPLDLDPAAQFPVSAMDADLFRRVTPDLPYPAVLALWDGQGGPKGEREAQVACDARFRQLAAEFADKRTGRIPVTSLPALAVYRDLSLEVVGRVARQVQSAREHQRAVLVWALWDLFDDPDLSGNIDQAEKLDLIDEINLLDRSERLRNLPESNKLIELKAKLERLNKQSFDDHEAAFPDVVSGLSSWWKEATDETHRDVREVQEWTPDSLDDALLDYTVASRSLSRNGLSEPLFAGLVHYQDVRNTVLEKGRRDLRSLDAAERLLFAAQQGDRVYGIFGVPTRQRARSGKMFESLVECFTSLLVEHTGKPGRRLTGVEFVVGPGARASGAPLRVTFRQEKTLGPRRGKMSKNYVYTQADRIHYPNRKHPGRGQSSKGFFESRVRRGDGAKWGVPKGTEIDLNVLRYMASVYAGQLVDTGRARTQ